MVAVRVADCAVVTADAFAVNVAEFAAAGTETELGIVIELLLLASATVKPPVGAEPESVTVHESFAAPVIDVVLHERPLTVGADAVPVPLKLTIAVGALLAMESWPVTEVAAAG